MKKLFNFKKPMFWIITGLVVTAIIITILVFNHFNSVDIGIIGGADGPTSIIVGSKTNNPTFLATILEINGNTVLVEPDPDSDEIKSADKITLPIEGIDDNIRAQLKPGSQIIVEYDGILQETYPAGVLNLYNIQVIV